MAEASPLSAASGGLRLAVRVVPKAQRSRIVGLVDDPGGSKALKVQVAAAPEAGKANDELLSVLAQALSLPRRDLALVAGAASRRKLIAIAGEAGSLRSRVEALWA
jgi:uncharacterized protein (TIGR00251 family)